jgi:hypothetical protein
MKKSALLFAAAISAALLLGACRATPVYNVNDQPVVVTAASYSMKDVRDAIIRAGARRGWTFTDAGTGKLIGHLDVRSKHSATVDVDYTREDFDINYRDSQGLKYDAAAGTIHKNYNSWVQNLANDIMTELSLL